ncbi:hypothetical protein BH20ACT5_BH20ACT5_14410 [soil metagenome]
MATTVRVSEATRARAAALAAESGVSIGDVVDQALQALETARFWQQTREALRDLSPDPDDELWERTVADGLDRD